eukprot:7528469-Pyramimonas_sp.AAC.1
MQRAQRLAVLSAIHDFRAWVVEPEANGILHKSLKKGPLPPTEIVVGQQLVYHPKDIMDAKAQ